MYSWFTSILLLNYNWKSFNKNCIDSILNQTYKNFEIIFIDNASTDWSLEEVERMFSKEIKSWIIKIVKNKENLRFAWWNNSWIPFVSKESKYIRLLNNDTIIDKNCLSEMIKWIESDEKLWAVSSIILDKWVEVNIKEKTANWEVRITNPFWLQIREKWEERNNIFYTNFLCWCSFLYKKNLVDFPFFDFYKAYAEDLQLSRELILKRYKLWICKNAIVQHFWSGTMNKNPKYLKLYYDNRNLLLNYQAFFSRKTRLKLFIPFVLFHTLQLIANAWYFRILLKAKFNSLMWIFKNKDKIDIVKKRINKWRKLSENEFLSSMSCKMASDDFHSGKVKMFIIDVVNFLNKLYCKLVCIPYIW